MMIILVAMTTALTHQKPELDLWGRRDHPRYAPHAIQLHMDGQEHDNA